MIFCTYHIWTSADTVGLNSGLSLNLYLFFVHRSSDYSGNSTHLHMLDSAFIVSHCNKYQNQICFVLHIKSSQTGHALDTNR